MSLTSVAEALRLMLGAAARIEDTESVPLASASGRVLATSIHASHDQPPHPLSAMDGYAVRAADLPGTLECVGESAAGRRFDGTVGPGQCCRIFTGAIVPDGADAVLIQENAEADGSRVATTEASEPGTYVRPAGLDYRKGEALIEERTKLSPAAISLIASTGATEVSVVRRPRVAILMNGDELALPGEALAADGIYASNDIGVAAIATQAGAEAQSFGIARDTRAALLAKLAEINSARPDVVVTLGGASVGDHDLVRPSFEAHGVELRFLKLAMRPGKPVMFGTRGSTLYLGLPGNPVSSLVGARVLLVPLLQALLGLAYQREERALPLASPVPPNGDREHYMRARVTANGCHAFENQDSSLLSVLAAADVLLVRPPHDPARETGETVTVLPL